MMVKNLRDYTARKIKLRIYICEQITDQFRAHAHTFPSFIPSFLYYLNLISLRVITLRQA